MCKKPVKRTETREENRFHKTEAAEALRREMKHCVEELFSDDPLQQLDRGKFSNYIASSHSPEQSISPTHLTPPAPFYYCGCQGWPMDTPQPCPNAGGRCFFSTNQVAKMIGIHFPPPMAGRQQSPNYYIPWKSENLSTNGLSDKTIILVGIYHQQLGGTILLYNGL